VVKAVHRHLDLDREGSSCQYRARSRGSARKSHKQTPEEFGRRPRLKNRQLAVVFDLTEGAAAAGERADFDDLLLESVRCSSTTRRRAGLQPAGFSTCWWTSTRTQPQPVRADAAAHRIAPERVVVGDEDQSIYSWRGADSATFWTRAGLPECADIRLSRTTVDEEHSGIGQLHGGANLERKGKCVDLARRG